MGTLHVETHLQRTFINSFAWSNSQQTPCSPSCQGTYDQSSSPVDAFKATLGGRESRQRIHPIIKHILDIWGGGGGSENRGYPFRGPFKGILFYLGSKRGTPLFREVPISTLGDRLWWAGQAHMLVATLENNSRASLSVLDLLHRAAQAIS